MKTPSETFRTAAATLYRAASQQYAKDDHEVARSFEVLVDAIEMGSFDDDDLHSMMVGQVPAWELLGLAAEEMAEVHAPDLLAEGDEETANELLNTADIFNEAAFNLRRKFAA